MTFTFQRRLDTFKHFIWPHSTKYKSQPEDFAQAGFYRRPMSESDDTVSCFLCFKTLDGWEPSDSAWQEHKSHSPTCPLATLNLQASRLRTFDKWPGERVKGGTFALADAGFYYLPRVDGDDTCLCYQCGLALDGWEVDDDPYYEHSRRRPNCPHVVNKEYIHPASFDFILAGKKDDQAIKDISQKNNVTIVPFTPARRTERGSGNTGQGQVPPPSTAKGKRIKISVPQSVRVKKRDEAGEESTAIKSQATPTRKPQSTPSSSLSTKNAIFTLFPALKNEPNLLNWTMEELLDQLIKEKVGKFKEFLREIEVGREE